MLVHSDECRTPYRHIPRFIGDEPLSDGVLIPTGIGRIERWGVVAHWKRLGAGL